MTNNGERYDINPAYPVGLDQFCHVDRYHFAVNGFVLPGDTVVDLGCGCGYGSVIVKGKNAIYWGVDRCPATVAHAQSRWGVPGVEFSVGDVLSDTDVWENMGDVVLAFEIAEHLPIPLTEFVDKLISLTSRTAVFSVPYMERPGNNIHHQHFEISTHSFDPGIKWFFQLPNSKIVQTMPEFCQNLIGVIHKND